MAAASAARPRGVTANCHPSQPPWILDTDRSDAGRHRQCGDLGHQAYTQPCGDQRESRRPSADGVSDDRIGKGGPCPELGVATGVVTDDPRLTGQFCYRHAVRLGQPVAMRDSDVQASGEHDLVLESGEVVIGQASADADDGDAQTAGPQLPEQARRRRLAQAHLKPGIRHRKATGLRWRKLNPGQQALLVLAYLRKGDDKRAEWIWGVLAEPEAAGLVTLADRARPPSPGAAGPACGWPPGGPSGRRCRTTR